MKRFLLLFACVFATLAFAMTALAMPAFADDDDDNNQVDTTLLPDSSSIYQVTIYALQNSDTYYEGQTVQITGEVVGDIINAEDKSDYRWITVDALASERAASIQVYVSSAQASLIDTLGRYGSVGTTIFVTGKFHLACGQHDGLCDIHATALSVQEKGSTTHEEFAFEDFVSALLLVALGLLLFAYYRKKREDQL